MGAPPIQLGSLGMADSLILMVMALVVFGPRRLPQIGRQIGKLMYEFRKASNDFKFQMEEELRLAEDADRRKKEEEKRKQTAQESVSATPALAQVAESQAPESRALASQTLDSPYPGEGQYPPDIKAAEPAPAQIAAEEVPRILPPSTGEPVAASPRSLAELPEPPAVSAHSETASAQTSDSTSSPSPSPAPVPSSSPVTQSDADTPANETVSHNG